MTVNNNKSSNPKHLARSCAMQALYQWDHNPVMAAQLLEDCVAIAGGSVDTGYLEVLIAGTLHKIEEIDAILTKHCDRPLNKLNSVELAIMRVALYELMEQLSVPYKVVVNEALELSKQYGAPDGYKYVNGVLDATLSELRSDEM